MISFFIALALALPAAGALSSTQISSANDHEEHEISKDVLDDEEFLEHYLQYFHNRVWEILASHGVQVGIPSERVHSVAETRKDMHKDTQVFIVIDAVESCE